MVTRGSECRPGANKLTQYGFLPNRFSKTRQASISGIRAQRHGAHTCTQALAQNADSHCEEDLCYITSCSRSNETQPQPQKCSLCPEDLEVNNRYAGCETDFCLFWQLNTFRRPERCDLSFVKGRKIDCNENYLFPLKSNSGQHAENSCKTQLQMYCGSS